VLKAIRHLLPAENLVYVADSAYAPYGDQTQEYITQRTLTIGNWLKHSGVKAITLACNTATVVAVKLLREQMQIPVVAIEPAIKPAVSLTRSGVVAVLATKQTVQSDSVIRLCQAHGADTKIMLQACPGLVELVEQGELNSPKIQALLLEFIEPLIKQGVDTLVMGCTHYSFLLETIASLFGTELSLIDPAPAVARELLRRLKVLEPSSPDQEQTHAPTHIQTHLFTTGDLQQALKVMPQLWGKPISVERLELESTGTKSGISI